ncbi:hypothetical protein SASPL_114620 [Salvia splendens]|uniref:Uncharacterized protein n=1 Tax=Salvia splendens TaxID=180675 RepID=A0A8X8Y0Z9_SALSN|nr:uncharacterized protein LOC121803892 [Salvia splendens]KAG6424206.1 hypothetical protein SASPL_114620 [Salvia splendens]
MAKYHESFTTPYSAVINDDDDEAPPSGCFRRFCFGRGDGSNYLLQESGVHEKAWLPTQLQKVKQWSEVVAGPKWKNLIRKIGRLCHCQKKQPPFQYSPESYALNFSADQEEANPLHSFSARFGPRVPIINHAAVAS